MELAKASKKERALVIKASGFHMTAWGARSVVVGDDVSGDEWKTALGHALSAYPKPVSVLQEFRKPARLEHSVFTDDETVGTYDRAFAPVSLLLRLGRPSEVERDTRHLLSRGQENHPRHEGRCPDALWVFALIFVSCVERIPLPASFNVMPLKTRQIQLMLFDKRYPFNFAVGE